MIRDWLVDQGLTAGPGIALVLFFLIFLGVLAWIFRPGSAAVYRKEAMLPLEDGTNTDAGNNGQGAAGKRQPRNA